MSLFRAAFLCLFLSACGFQPLYGEKAGTHLSALSSIAISNIPDRDGQYLRNLLTDKLYQNARPENPLYLLSIAPLKKDTTNLGMRKDATTTRAQTDVSAHFVLTDAKNGAVLLERDVRSTGAYNILDSQFTTLVSEQSTSEHILEELSDNIVRELDLYFRRAAP